MDCPTPSRPVRSEPSRRGPWLRGPWLLAVALLIACVPWWVTAKDAQDRRTDAASDDSVSDDSVRQSVEAPLDGVVEIDGVTGTLVVSGWDRPSVEVTGRLGRDLESVLLERRGERVLLRMRQSLVGRPANLSIRVPRAARLEVESMNLDLRITGITGGVDTHVISGTQRLTGAGADSEAVRLETVSGVLQVDGALREVELLAVSGPIGVDAQVEELRVDSVNGPQDLRLRGARRVDLDSLNGPIQLDLLEPSPRLVASASTFNGRLSLGLEATQKMVVEATAKHGRIDNRAGGDEERSTRDGFQAVLTARFGGSAKGPMNGGAMGEGAGGRITASTYRGDIVLRPLG